MKVYELIRELAKYDPHAEVRSKVYTSETEVECKECGANVDIGEDVHYMNIDDVREYGKDEVQICCAE